MNAIASSLAVGEGSNPDDAAVTAAQAIPRLQTPDDVTGTLSFLASADAAFVTGQMHPWREMTLEHWRRVQSVNVDSLFLTTQAFVPANARARLGRVVSVTSGSGWIPSRDFNAYVTSKLAVVGYTRGLAIELGDGGVTVNAIARASCAPAPSSRRARGVPRRDRGPAGD